MRMDGSALSAVIAGLDPAIQLKNTLSKMDHRVSRLSGAAR
jgi:hypothetical protein